MDGAQAKAQKPEEATQTAGQTQAQPVQAAPSAPNLATKEAPAEKPPEKLAAVLDIPLRVSVELGRARILVQDLLKLTKGSVLELNKLAGENLEVLVNEKVVAKGEVIVVNEKFGIRLTDIVSHDQRIRELGP